MAKARGLVRRAGRRPNRPEDGFSGRSPLAPAVPGRPAARSLLKCAEENRSAKRGRKNADEKADPVLPGNGAVYRSGAVPGAIFEPVQPGGRGAMVDPPGRKRNNCLLCPVPPAPIGVLRPKKRLCPGNRSVQRHEKYSPPLPAAHRFMDRCGTAGGGTAGHEPLCVAGGGAGHRAAGTGGHYSGPGGIWGAFRGFGQRDRCQDGGAANADPL